MHYTRRMKLICLAILPALALSGLAQSGTHAADSTRPREHAAGRDSAPRAERAYAQAVAGGPLSLRAFLADFPKGADLHVHLSGAVYAETFVRDAGEDGLCVDPATLSFAKPPCTETLVEAKKVPGNQDLYDRLINSFSMRSFVATPGFSGHDQFFATFGKFGGLNKSHTGEWIDEVASRAAQQNQQYLELMQTPPFGHAAGLARQIGWHPAEGQTHPDFAQLRQQLLDGGLRDEVATDREEARTAAHARKALEHCGTPKATPACRVEVRSIYQVLRAFSPEQVFAQTLLGFETVQASLEDADADGKFVGINFVQPEDNYVAMRDYAVQMEMIGYLHSLYPRVRISLHAGELAEGMVPPEGMKYHIRLAIEVAGAERIGHGVDVLYEDRGEELLHEMAARHVMVEINLSSNEGILNITGNRHPFPLYRAAHVPVALSTDDEGVSRIDITHEYVRAALDYHLSYGDLKTLARTSMEHNFLSGKSLWAVQDQFGQTVAVCRAEKAGAEKPAEACRKFLESNEKAAAEWELESRLQHFESKF